MDNIKSKNFLLTIVSVSTLIVAVIGATFAYFTAMVDSEEGAVNMVAAVYKVEMKDDTSLLKTALIPSAEKYVDMATIARRDANGDFVRPYEEDGKVITEKTACIDDNLNEICSIYTFTIQNPMTNATLPVYVTLNTTINTFSNLYFKVVDENKNVVMNAQRLVDDRPFELGSDGEKIYESGSRISPVVLSGIDVTLPKATTNGLGTVVPSEATFSIIMWIMETNTDQTKQDSNQMFAATLKIESSNADGGGITGVFTSAGEE